MHTLYVSGDRSQTGETAVHEKVFNDDCRSQVYNHPRRQASLFANGQSWDANNKVMLI